MERKTILATVIAIEDIQEVIDQRNRLFPGWQAYGLLPDHSRVYLSLRDHLYPGWWTTKDAALPTELKPFYRVRCQTLEEANYAIFVQPRNVRAEIEIIGIGYLKDIDWIQLIKPPFCRTELIHSHK